MNTTPLRDLIADRVGQRWETWSAAHPHLAAAIDRVRLVESAVARLRDDPEFTQAWAQAQVDEDKLGATLKLITLAERLIARLLPV
jgi:hypothetical protein